MSDETTRNESERQPCNVRLLGFSAGTEIGLGDLVKRVASTFGIAFQVVMALLALEAGAVADIVDVSPTVTSFPVTTQHSVSGIILSLAVSGDRLYAGAFAGVWRSDDAGLTWRQLTRPQPPEGVNEVPGALMVPDVYDLAVSPVNRDLVLAATQGHTRIQAQSRNGIYRSVDGGETWRLVHQFHYKDRPGQADDCQAESSVSLPVGQIVFAPYDPNVVYSAGGCAVAISVNGGQNWTDIPVVDAPTRQKGKVWHVAAAPPQGTILRVYAAGNNGQIWYSQDGGLSWYRDGASNIPVIAGGLAANHNDSSAHVLVVEPGRPDHVYLAVPGLANGPSFYHPQKFGPDGEHCNRIKFVDTNGDGAWSINETVVLESEDTNNSRYDSGETVIVGGTPVVGAFLKLDASVKYVDSNSNGLLDVGEIVVYDTNANDKYDAGEPVIRGNPPSP